LELYNNSPDLLPGSDGVYVIRSRQQFLLLEENWNSIYKSDDEANIFLSWQWLNQLYERRHESVFILAFKSSPGNNFFSALLPLRKGVTFDAASGAMQNTVTTDTNHRRFPHLLMHYGNAAGADYILAA